jgi:GNAT superfamily N-acetyltransferase
MCVATLHAAGAWPADASCAPQRRSAARPRPAALRCAASADAGAAAEDAVPAPIAAGSQPPCALRSWRRGHTLRDGTRVLLRPAALSEGPALAEMLADAFAVSIAARQYRCGKNCCAARAAWHSPAEHGTALPSLRLVARSKVLGRLVSTYITARLATPPEEAVLIVAVPCSDASDGGAGAGASDEGQPAAQLLGVVELSLTPRTHGRFDDAAVAPPAHAAFVKNVLSSPTARRRGVAAALLAGVEDYAAAAADAADASRAPLELCLHCTLGDAPAAALYAAAGYAVVAQQNGVVAALRRSAPPVALMRKHVPRP